VSCPICGANCKCRKRGAGGICCSCHRHKVRRLLVAREVREADPLFQESYDQHLEWMKRSIDEETRQRELELTNAIAKDVA